MFTIWSFQYFQNVTNGKKIFIYGNSRNKGPFTNKHLLGGLADARCDTLKSFDPPFLEKKYHKFLSKNLVYMIFYGVDP